MAPVVAGSLKLHPLPNLFRQNIIRQPLRTGQCLVVFPLVKDIGIQFAVLICGCVPFRETHFQPFTVFPVNIIVGGFM